MQKLWHRVQHSWEVWVFKENGGNGPFSFYAVHKSMVALSLDCHEVWNTKCPPHQTKKSCPSHTTALLQHWSLIYTVPLKKKWQIWLHLYGFNNLLPLKSCWLNTLLKVYRRDYKKWLNSDGVYTLLVTGGTQLHSSQHKMMLDSRICIHTCTLLTEILQ